MRGFMSSTDISTTDKILRGLAPSWLFVLSVLLECLSLELPILVVLWITKAGIPSRANDEPLDSLELILSTKFCVKSLVLPSIVNEWSLIVEIGTSLILFQFFFGCLRSCPIYEIKFAN